MVCLDEHADDWLLRRMDKLAQEIRVELRKKAISVLDTSYLKVKVITTSKGSECHQRWYAVTEGPREKVTMRS